MTDTRKQVERDERIITDAPGYSLTAVTPPNIIQIHNTDSRALLTIRPDGTVEGDVADASEAGRIFCEYVAAHFGDQRKQVEREIAEWLRMLRDASFAHHKEICLIEDDEILDDIDDDILDALVTRANTYAFAADQIERGEYRKDEA